MKRQRNVDGGATMKVTKPEGTSTMKKSKQVVEKVEDKRRNSGALCPLVDENLLRWEEWPWLRGAVDEQMSWGSIWLPFWDLEFMGEACSALFNDVVWDDDIWNLKSIKEIPNP